MHHVEVVPALTEQTAGLAGLGDALIGQADVVDPAGESVLEVPLALAVAQEDELFHGRESSRLNPEEGLPRQSRSVETSPHMGAA